MKKTFDLAIRSLLVCVICVIAPQTFQGQEWRTGDDFQNAVGDPGLSVGWMSAKLANELRIASDAVRLAVFLDRRVDPGQLFAIQVDNISFEQLLWRIADENESAVIRLENLMYVGPANSAIRLQQNCLEFRGAINNRKVPTNLQRALNREVELVKTEPFEPANELRSVLQEHNLKIKGLSLVPHDFWGPIELPKMPLSQLLNVILAGFDLRLQLTNENNLEIVPVDFNAPSVYWLSAAQSLDLDRDWLQNLQGIAFEKSGGAYKLEGTSQDMLLAIRQVAFRSAKGLQERPAGKSVLSLHTVARRGDIVSTIANHLKLKTSFSAECQTSLEQIIEIDLREATAEDILGAALEGSDVEFRVTDTTVELFKKNL